MILHISAAVKGHNYSQPSKVSKTIFLTNYSPAYSIICEPIQLDNTFLKMTERVIPARCKPPNKDHSQYVSFQFKCNVHIKYLVCSKVEYFGVI